MRIFVQLRSKQVATFNKKYIFSEFLCRMAMNIHISLLLVSLVVLGSLLGGSADKGSTTVAPNTGNVSTPTSASATTKPSISCEQRNSSCGSCTDDSKCYWCSADSSCKVYPSSKIIPRDCKGNKWFWKQCLVPGRNHLECANGMKRKKALFVIAFLE